MQLPQNSGNSRKKQMRRVKAALTAASFVVLPATSALLAGFGTAHAAGNGLITGLVFNDVDRNGSQAVSGEPGVDGITATAYTSLAGVDTEVGTAVTANGGMYSMNLNATVASGDPIKVIFTGLGTNQAVNPSQTTQTVFMGPGTSGGTFEGIANLGVVTSSSISVSIGDRIWIDTNGDGVQNATEVAPVPQLGGITVDLLDATGVKLASTVTNADGYYRFVDPATYTILGGATAGSGITSYAFPSTGGTYKIRVNGLSTAGSKLAGYTNTVLNGAGATTENDSDGATCETGSGAPAGTICDPISGVITVPADTSYSNQTIDFGVLPYNYSVAQQAVSTTVTPGGTASFNVTVTNLGPGSATPCTIINLLPAGLTYAALNPITNLSANASFSAIDPNDQSKLVLNCNTRIGLNEAVTFTVNTVVAANATGTLKNFTYVAESTTDVAGAERIPLAYSPTNASNSDTTGTDNDSQALVTVSAAPATASLGDKVWFDLNKNGIQESGEGPAAGVSVQLLDASGIAIAGQAKSTDANGMYSFTGLNAGTYSVQFGKLANYTYTTQNAAGGTEATDSDVNTTSGISDPVTLAAGENNPNVDAGLIALASGTTASLGDKVWVDGNSNGILDGSEAGFAGLTVTLYNAAGGQVDQKTTDAQGMYLFSNLAAGSYSVTFSPAGANYRFTTSNAGTDRTIDSDADPVSGKTVLFPLADGEALRTIDAGLVVASNNTASLGNYVWNDLDKDGLQDANEVGVSDVLVTLTDVSGAEAPRTARTDATGKYIFANLAAGTYKVTFAKPIGYSLSLPLAGTDRSTDSDADVTTGMTANIVVGAGSQNDTIDAGMYADGLGSIGDRVWIDTDGNGLQNGSEVGLGGVTVKLLDAAGNTVQTKTTDANGNYLFSSLAPGSYTVEFTNPTGYTFTTSGAGTDRTIDSDANSTTGRSGIITVAAGQNITTVDAGLIKTVTVAATTTVATTAPPAATTTTPVVTVAPPIPFPTPTSSTVAPASSTTTTVPVSSAPSSSTTTAKPATPVVTTPGTPVVANPTCKINSVVWIDNNANGVVDSGEQVMPGVTVRVTAGGVVKEAVTDSLGRYSFVDVNCGDVVVEIIAGLPAGTPLPAPKTIKVLGETALAPLLVPFGVQLPTVEEVAYGGAESRQFFAAALTFLGMGGLLVSRKRKEAGVRR